MLSTESRTRVICHLPYNNSSQEVALHKIITFVKKQKKIKAGVTGYTYSDSFHGGWWSEDRDKWIKDRIVMLMIDYKVDLDDAKISLLSQVDKLRRTIVQHYSSLAQKEDEFWIVSEPLTRYF